MPGRARYRRSAARSISALATMDSPGPAAATTCPVNATILDRPSVEAAGIAVPVWPPVLAETTYARFSTARADLAMSFGVANGLPASAVECTNTSAPRSARARASSGERISSEAMAANAPMAVCATGRTASGPYTSR